MMNLNSNSHNIVDRRIITAAKSSAVHRRLSCYTPTGSMLRIFDHYRALGIGTIAHVLVRQSELLFADPLSIP